MSAMEFMSRISEGGGLAFPGKCSGPDGGTMEWQGMTMRQWYAGQALQGLLAGTTFRVKEIGEEVFAEAAFGLADAMLKAEQA